MNSNVQGGGGGAHWPDSSTRKKTYAANIYINVSRAERGGGGAKRPTREKMKIRT